MSRREYDGPALDLRYQHITERPELDGERDLVYATEPEPAGRETVENVPVPSGPDRGVGQTRLVEWSR